MTNSIFDAGLSEVVETPCIGVAVAVDGESVVGSRVDGHEPSLFRQLNTRRCQALQNSPRYNSSAKLILQARAPGKYHAMSIKCKDKVRTIAHRNNVFQSCNLCEEALFFDEFSPTGVEREPLVAALIAKGPTAIYMPTLRQNKCSTVACGDLHKSSVWRESIH